jgi:hypothetical protein
MLSKMISRLPNNYDVRIVDRGFGLLAQLTGGEPEAYVLGFGVARELDVISRNQRCVRSG